MVVGVVAAQGLRAPIEKSQPATLDAPKASISHLNPSFTPLQMLQTPIFWLMFAMMTMMSTAGLMVTSQIAAFTHDFGIANALVFGLPLLPLPSSVDRITNVLTPPSSACLSHHISPMPPPV